MMGTFVYTFYDQRICTIDNSFLGYDRIRSSIEAAVDEDYNFEEGSQCCCCWCSDFVRWTIRMNLKEKTPEFVSE